LTSLCEHGLYSKSGKRPWVHKSVGRQLVTTTLRGLYVEGGKARVIEAESKVSNDPIYFTLLFNFVEKNCIDFITSIILILSSIAEVIKPITLSLNLFSY